MVKYERRWQYENKNIKTGRAVHLLITCRDSCAIPNTHTVWVHLLDKPSESTHTHRTSSLSMHSRGFDGFQSPPLLLWSSSEHIHSGRIEGTESVSSIIQKIQRGPQQGNEMDDFFPPFLCIHGTLHSNMLSLYFTFPWYLASTRRLRPLFPFGRLAFRDKDTENKKERRW